jgi:beta-glucanase (GH16 family)
MPKNQNLFFKSRKEVIMKKIILPFVAVALLAACSESDTDSNFVAPQNPTGEISSSSVAAVPTSSETVVAPTSSDAVLPASSAVAPASSEVATPTSSAAVTPNQQFTYKVPTLVELDPIRDYTFYGAELTGVEQYKYGRFEARMKMAAISGSVSSMFLNYDNSWMKEYEPWNEIDIEVLGKDPTSWQSNIITREAEPSIKNNTSSESKPLHAFGFDATQEFHLYAIVWTPEYVAWEIDSVEVRRDTLGMSRGTHADADQVKFLTEKETLRFNLWVSKSAGWTGKWNNGIGLPVEQQIDYVRVYSYDEATKTFTKLWQDDFDGEDLDPKRWTAGDWEMERVMLRQNNVVVEQGVCRLILDYEAN